MDDDHGTEERRALNEPEAPRGNPLAIVYDGQQAHVTQDSGQVVYWDAPIDTVADYARQGRLVSVPTTTPYVAAWRRPTSA